MNTLFIATWTFWNEGVACLLRIRQSCFKCSTIGSAFIKTSGLGFLLWPRSLELKCRGRCCEIDKNIQCQSRPNKSHPIASMQTTEYEAFQTINNELNVPGVTHITLLQVDDAMIQDKTFFYYTVCRGDHDLRQGKLSFDAYPRTLFKMFNAVRSRGFGFITLTKPELELLPLPKCLPSSGYVSDTVETTMRSRRGGRAASRSF